MTSVEPGRDRALQEYRKKLLEHKEVESRLKESRFLNRLRGYVCCEFCLVMKS